MPISAGIISSALWISWAQTVFHVDVRAVVVSFTVRDSSGRYVSGLQPSNVTVREDGVEQRINNFMDSSVPLESIAGEMRKNEPIPSSVFVLFDTSNCMYDGFARSEDTIANFIRHLDPRQAVAVYAFSQNLSRLTGPTDDHDKAIRALRTAVAGDSTAMLNATLLTIRDAACIPGRKQIVVFSNGPDDASVVAPADVARVAEEEGIPIYIIAAKPANELCERAFGLICTTTGGKLFLAKSRPRQIEAFDYIAGDLGHTYTLTYYPQASSNSDWRKIDVQVQGADGTPLKTFARRGYWPTSALAR